MICLAIDTSTRAGVTVLQEIGGETEPAGRCLAELVLNVEMVHGRQLLPAIDSLLKLAGVSLEQIQAVALVCGPGSFTGLRVGLSTLQGLFTAADLPTAALSSLEVLAAGVGPTSKVIRPVLHARKGFVYTSAFRWTEARPQRLEADREVTVDGFAESVTEPALLAGNAFKIHGELWREALADRIEIADETRHTVTGRALGRIAAHAHNESGMASVSRVCVDYLGPCQAEINFEARHGKQPDGKRRGS